MTNNIFNVGHSIRYIDLVITQMCFVSIQFSVAIFTKSLFLITPLLINLSFQIIYFIVLKIWTKTLKKQYSFHFSVLCLFNSLGFLTVSAYTIDSTFKLKTLVFFVLLLISVLIILFAKICSKKKNIVQKKQSKSRKVSKFFSTEKIIHVAILLTILFCFIGIINITVFLKFCSIALGLLLIFPFANQIRNNTENGSLCSQKEDS